MVMVWLQGRGEEKQELARKPGYKARRWIVEAAHSWLNRFHKRNYKTIHETNWSS
jgi:hypothetical protein